MGKRQRRIYRGQFDKELPLLVHLQVQVITQEGRALAGTIESCAGQVISLRDGRRFVHHLPFAHVEEVVLDTEAAH